MLSMWEFGMDGGRYDVTEFRNRHLTLPALDDDSVQPESLLSRSALQINATTKCIIEAHAILECFVGIPTDTLQKAPNLQYVRAIYALVVLMKADYAVGTDPEMGEILDSQSLKVDAYLQTVLQKCADAIGPQKCRMPTHWTMVLQVKLISWRDEYLEWRRAGRHLKRRKLDGRKVDDAESAPATNKESAHDALQPPPSLSTTPLAPPQQQPPLPPQPFLPTPNPYAWPADSQPPAFPPDIMGDFSAAFQHGDLYLWNDGSDNFGGWMPQGRGLYADMDMGFGGGDGQGY